MTAAARTFAASGAVEGCPIESGCTDPAHQVARHAATDGDQLPPLVQYLADVFLHAWCTTAGRYWHEAGAMLAVNAPGPIRDGQRALTLAVRLRPLHQPVPWAEGSDVVVCTCGVGAYDSCPTAQLLDELA